jgi:hypothetical protein
VTYGANFEINDRRENDDAHPYGDGIGPIPPSAYIPSKPPSGNGCTGLHFCLRPRVHASRYFPDILIAVVDRPKGFPEAPKAVLTDRRQTCIVSPDPPFDGFRPWKDSKSIARALCTVYREAERVPRPGHARRFCTRFVGAKYPAIT